MRSIEYQYSTAPQPGGCAQPDRHVIGNFSTRSFRNHHFSRHCQPLGFLLWDNRALTIDRTHTRVRSPVLWNKYPREQFLLFLKSVDFVARPGDGLLAEGRVFFFGMALQRGYGGGTLSSITHFPGARFIIAGLLSKPGSYYKVQPVGRVQRHLSR